MKRVSLIVAALCAAFVCFAGNISHVNVFMGSAGDHGQTTPGASVPLGAISVCPDCVPWQHAGYDYDVPVVSGISISRISGTGCSGVGGNLRIRPAMPADTLRMVKSAEKAVPGYYETAFDNGASARLTATRNMAVERYVFGKKRILYLDFLSAVDVRNTSCEYNIVDNNTIEGWMKSPTVCARGSYKWCFKLVTGKPFKVKDSGESNVLLEFDCPAVEVRIAVSPIDGKVAGDIISSWNRRSFDSIRKDACAQWKEKLGRVNIAGGDEEQKALFYTGLYLLYHSPMDATSPEGRYLGTDGKVYSAAPGRVYYSSWSMWDTFRTKFPMISVLEPSLARDISWSLADLYHTGKRNWATPYESGPTVRTEHSVVTLLDYYRKGLATVEDLEHGYSGMVNEADGDYPLRQPDQRLESAYDFWALGQVAGILGKTEDAALYSSKGEKLFTDTWKKHFMNVDDSYTLMKRNGLYQGTRWQYRWMCAEYLDKVIELKGKDALCSELDTFFENQLFNQGNEPDIQAPFLFNRFGAPDKTCEVVRAYLTDDKMVHIYGGNAEYPVPYVGRAFRNAVDGYAPEMDEDDGAMSAWYMFAQMGFYPLCPGTDKYELFSPLFDRITIKLDNGKKAVIRVCGRSSYADRIRSITLDGKELPDRSLTHDFFVRGGELVFHY